MPLFEIDESRLDVNPEYKDKIYSVTDGLKTSHGGRKGRSGRPPGFKGHGRKLADQQVRQIRALCKAGYKIIDIAESYGLGTRTIAQVRDRITYKDIED